VDDPAVQNDRDGVALSASYEALRAAVVSGRSDGWRHGHGVLARAGMAGWMAARAAVAPTPGTAAPSAPDPSTPPSSQFDPTTTALSSLPGAEIVAVLSQMALAHL
jgi:hypothetical protein